MEVEMELLENIEIGCLLDAYHDGKVSPSRHAIVVVDGIGTCEDMTKREVALWRKALKEDFTSVFVKGTFSYPSRFWDWNCDWFLSGHFMSGEGKKKHSILFAKMYGVDRWYAVNWNYMLDLTGELRVQNWDTWTKCASEMGQELKWVKERHKFQYLDKKTGMVVDEL